MKLKVNVPKAPKHAEPVLGLGWLNSDEVISCADDHQLLKWNMSKAEPTELAAFKGNIFPTSMQFIPRHGRQPNNDVFLLTSSDGKIHIVNGTGKIEKTIDAHEGAALSVRWSGDATSFLSCGEEGAVKMWSRSGMLRSVLAQNGRPVYAVDWNADGTKVIYCAGENCFIKSLKAQMNPTKWKAHEGVVLCLTWCPSTDMIVTGGEDCRYRIWDGFGRPLYSSNSHNFPITSVAWNPDGELLAVGSFNILRLCDKAGWSHSLDKLNSGSIYSLCWSPDGTQLVAGCANGQVVHANVIEKRIYHNNLEAVQSKRKTIEIRDVLSDVARERLETRERITKIQLGFNHLVVATTKQIYVFSSRNWNTPVMMDLKESSVQLVIRLAEKFFLLIDGARIEVRSYEGRVVSTIKPPGTAHGEAWTEKTAAIANDCVALVDRAQRNVILMYDAQTASAVGNGKITHVVDVVELALNQCGTLADRRVAFVDVNSDCYLAVVNAYATLQKVEKLGSLVTNITFNNTTNMLAAFQDRKLVVWTVPSVVFTDKEMLPKTMIELETGDMGKSAFMIGFIGNTITVRRSDGCLIPCYVPPFASGVIRCITANKWDQAVRICRQIKEEYLWAMLAVSAAAVKNFYVAEIAYGELLETEKVIYLRDVREETNPQIKDAMMAMFTGNKREAELSFSQNGRTFRAIMFSLSMFDFNRALELAVKSGSHLDTVLGYRQRYLEKTGRRETDPNFLKHLSEVEIDWQHIREKVQEDWDKEKKL